MTLSKQEEREKRFDERFLKRITNPLGWKLPRIAYFWEQSGKDVEWEDMEVELKAFLQSEIDLALAERDREVVEKIENWIEENYSSDPTTNQEVADVIINLITNK